MDISTLRDEESLHAFVGAFERGELPRALWTHGAHVAIAALYTVRHGDDVLATTRVAIQRHNAAVGTPANAYHETLTVFWLGAVGEFLERAACASELDAVRAAVAEFGERRKLHAEYYSFDVVASDEARAGWVPPDVRELEIRFILTTY
jgi:hypothetical protein